MHAGGVGRGGGISDSAPSPIFKILYTSLIITVKKKYIYINIIYNLYKSKNVIIDVNISKGISICLLVILFKLILVEREQSL